MINRYSNFLLYKSLFYLQVDGQEISWQHLIQLYEAKMGMVSHSNGLALLQKLSIEHIQLTSFSRMRVDLAAEVCQNLLQILQWNFGE